MEKGKVLTALRGEIGKFNTSVADYFRTVFNRAYDSIVTNSKKYRELEAREKRYLSGLSNLAVDRDKLAELAAQVEGYKKSEEGYEGERLRLTGENARLRRDLEDMASRNANLAMENVGLRREYAERGPLIEKLQKETEHLRRSERIALRKQYDTGKYRNRAIFVTNVDSGIVMQNMAARRLLGHFGKVRLTDYVSVNENEPQVVKFGNEVYMFSFTRIRDGYEVEVEKEKHSFFKSSKTPYVLNIREIPASVLVPVPSS